MTAYNNDQQLVKRKPQRNLNLFNNTRQGKNLSDQQHRLENATVENNARIQTIDKIMATHRQLLWANNENDIIYTEMKLTALENKLYDDSKIHRAYTEHVGFLPWEKQHLFHQLEQVCF